MRANYILFLILGIFFIFTGILYLVWNVFTTGGLEWAGNIALFLVGIMSLFISFYLHRVHGEQGGELPEDRLEANIDDRDSELGQFSPWSWWPVVLASGVAFIALGLAIGFWIAFIGAGITIVSLIGWVFEYYRGFFAR